MYLRSGARLLVALALLPLLTVAVPAASAAHRPARIVYVALGVWDSDGHGTANPATQSMPAQLARYLPPGSRYLNVAIGNQGIRQGLATQLPLALAAHPTLVTIGEFGWVDMARTVGHADQRDFPHDDLAHFKVNLGTMLAAFHRIHARVFVANLPNMLLVPEDQFGGAALDPPGRAYNAAIAAVARRYGAVVVDIYAHTSLLFPHPESIFTPRGNAVWAGIFYRAMHRQGVL